MKINTNYKIKIILWINVFLFTLNITILVSFLLTGKEYRSENPKVDTSEHKKSMMLVQDFVENKVHLTSDQKKKFNRINVNFHTKMRQLSQVLDKSRVDMLNEMAASNPDTVKLKLFAESCGNIYKASKELTIWHYVEVMKILDKDQQKDFKKIYSDLLMKGH